MTDVRPAALEDVTDIARLCLGAAQARAMADPALWALPPDPMAVLRAALSKVIGAMDAPFGQSWQVSETGAIRSLLLPVPPIYLGRWGAPGLIQPDGAAIAKPEALIAAAEARLMEDGARVLLGAARPGDVWEEHYLSRGYTALTVYYAGADLKTEPVAAPRATGSDVSRIVEDSAVNRRVLHDLDPFWEPHADADTRFGGWMHKSLALPDRVLRVGADGQGYVIAQPAGPLHIPPPHPTEAIGFIDDWFHPDFALRDAQPAADGPAATLLRSAERDLADMGRTTALVVCPALWTSKRRLLEALGYAPALMWFIRRPDPD